MSCPNWKNLFFACSTLGNISLESLDGSDCRFSFNLPVIEPADQFFIDLWQYNSFESCRPFAIGECLEAAFSAAILRRVFAVVVLTMPTERLAALEAS